MSKILGGAPKPNNSAIVDQQKRLAEQEKKTADAEAANREKSAAKLRAQIGRSGTGAGGNTLLTGLETGLRDTLG